VTADREEELVLRAAWAIALTIEVYRTAMVWPGSPLLTIPPGKTADLLALATSDVVEELGALLALARERLFPQLMTKQSPWHFGPTFTGSHLIPADADLVAEDLLVEVKTGLGRKRPDGTRQAQLEANTIRQILGYLLLDFDNIYQITEIGYYDARYGHLSTWSATKLLQETAERDIELHDLRREFHELLRHGKL
jgi:hypothetical protein